MMASVPSNTRSRCVVPAELRSPRGKLVYLYLSTKGTAELEEIGEDLDIPLITLCGLLRTLESRQIIERDGGSYRITI